MIEIYARANSSLSFKVTFEDLFHSQNMIQTRRFLIFAVSLAILAAHRHAPSLAATTLRLREKNIWQVTRMACVEQMFLVNWNAFDLEWLESSRAFPCFWRPNDRAAVTTCSLMLVLWANLSTSHYQFQITDVSTVGQLYQLYRMHIEQHNLFNNVSVLYVEHVLCLGQKKKKQVEYRFLTRFEESAQCCSYLHLNCSYAHRGCQRSVIVEFPRADVDAGSIA